MFHKVFAKTERLVLRTYREDDGPTMYANWASDPEVTQFLTWPPHPSVEESCRICRLFSTQIEAPIWQFAIELKATGQLVGGLMASVISKDVGRCEVGYCIGRAFWGQGLMTEALEAVVQYLFDQGAMNRIEAWHDVKNPSSGRVLEKCGLTKEGVLRRSRTANQGIYDAAVWALLKEEWQTRL